jgi:hypothetical protein
MAAALEVEREKKAAQLARLVKEAEREAAALAKREAREADTWRKKQLAMERNRMVCRGTLKEPSHLS